MICGLGQLAVNWSIFMRAINRTKPLFVAALVDVAVFFVVMIPAVLTLGMTGYVIGFGTNVLVQLFVRTYFMRTTSRLQPRAAYVARDRAGDRAGRC